MQPQSNRAETLSIKQQPLWTVPVVLAILMISSGAFFVLLALGISILSSVSY